MHNVIILYPLFAMLLLLAAVSIGIRRVSAKSTTDDISGEYLQLHANPSLSRCFIRLTHHYDNLLELPILFSTACVLIFAADKADRIFIGLAWIYVILRYAHAYIFVNYNNLVYRRLTFIAATCVLFIMWIKLFIELAVI